MKTFIYVDTYWKFYLLQHRLKDERERLEKMSKDLPILAGLGGYWKRMLWCVSNYVPTDLHIGI